MSIHTRWCRIFCKLLMLSFPVPHRQLWQFSVKQGQKFCLLMCSYYEEHQNSVWKYEHNGRGSKTFVWNCFTLTNKGLLVPGWLKTPTNIMVDEQLLNLQNVLRCFGITMPRIVLHGIEELSPAVKESLRYAHIRLLVQYLCFEISHKF